MVEEEDDECLSPFGRTFAASTIGNICEWYDFAAFAGLADILGEKLFPPQNSAASLMEALAVFGAAFFMRPIGGAWLGYLADTVGRKQALELSIIIMVIPSFCIGLVPTYAQVGWLATFVLVALRLIQGVAVGGELVTAYTFVAEHAPSRVDGPAWTGLVLDSANCGTLLGIATVAIFRLAMSPESLRSWGWRLVFFLGLPIGALGLLLRRKIEDSPEFLKKEAENKSEHKQEKNPLKILWNDHKLDVFLVAGASSMWCGGFYATFVWMTFYYSYDIAGLEPVPQGPAINACMLGVLCLLFLPMAYTTRAVEAEKEADLNARRAMKRGQLILAISAIPIFALIGHFRNAASAVFGQFIFGIALSSFGAGLPFFLVHAFPLEVRVAGIGAAYNISQAIFAGAAPIVMTALLEQSKIFPGIALVVLALFSFAMLIVYERRETKKDKRQTSPKIELATIAGPGDDVGLC